MSQPKPLEDAFVRYLISLEPDKNLGALAALRRGLSGEPRTVAAVFPYVVPYLPTTATLAEQQAYELVAALFATHREHWYVQRGQRELRNMGASFARLSLNRAKESLEKRFVALLNASGEDLRYHLRHAVALLKASDISIDWAQLLRDVQEWGDEDRPVQRAWARAFWGALSPREGTETNDVPGRTTADSEQ